jgi:DNA-directed RNA polymerase subunit beta'
LKENVIVGRLVPAGTGLSYHNERRKNKAKLNIDQAFEQVIVQESALAAGALAADAAMPASLLDSISPLDGTSAG